MSELRIFSPDEIQQAQAQPPRTQPQLPDGDYTLVSHAQDGDEHIQLTYKVGGKQWWVLMSFAEAQKHADNIKSVVRMAMKAKAKVK